MATAKELLAIAASQLGTCESPAGSNNVKYNTAYYGREINHPDYAWCAVFIWGLFREAGAGELYYGGGRTASCTTLCGYHRGQATTDYRPGDIIFFDFSGQKKKTRHVGICESCQGGYITTIDGNTGTGNEANGGAVMRRKRALKYVSGAYRPAYEEDTMTEQDIKKLIDRALAERDEAAVQSAQKVSLWARESWDKAAAKAVFDGTRPGGNLTREQAAVVLDRLGLL